MSEVDKHLHGENAQASSSSSTLSPICAKFPELKGLMEGNRVWAEGCKKEMPELLPKLATGQVSLSLNYPPRHAGARSTVSDSIPYRDIGEMKWIESELMTDSQNPLDWMCRLSSPRNIDHCLEARRYLCSCTFPITAKVCKVGLMV